MPKEQEQSMWDLKAGLPLDGQRVRTHDCTFTFRQDYLPDQIVLVVGLQPIDEDGDDVEGSKSREQLYSIGRGYEATDEDGTSVKHKSGKFVNFNENSNVGKWIHAYVVARGDGDFDEGLQAVKAEGAEPHIAAYWDDMDVTLKAVAQEGFIDKSGNKTKDRTTLVIDQFNGRIGEAVKPAGKKLAGKTTEAKTTTKATPAASGGDTFDDFFDAPLLRKLNKAAVAADDHDAFCDVCFEGELQSEIVTDDAAWNKKASKFIMAFKDGSLFATARAD